MILNVVLLGGILSKTEPFDRAVKIFSKVKGLPGFRC